MSVVVSNEKRVRIALEEDEYEIGKKEAPEAAGKENGPSEQPAEKPPKKPDKPEKHQPVQSPSSPDEQHAMLTDGNASFLRAARGGNLDKVLEYLQGSTDINTSNANGLNALHLSSKEGHLNIVTELLKRGADVDAATKKGNTALHIASLAGQEDIVSVLVQFNANVNVQSQNGFTPLYMAAQENHVKVVKFLLANGANQNLATEDGFLPLDVATQQGHDVVVETLLQHSRPQYPNKSEDGFTPLAVALQQGHDKVVAVLLENDRAGKTRLPALHIAARKDDTKAASLLLQNGHNPDVPSKSGFTPLHIAAHYGHVNVATILLQKGASVDYAARNHITPLHVAAKWGRVNMVNTLLDRGARIDAKTRDGLTPLHCSARSGHEQCVDQLLERGAPISAKTKNGLAPLHMAAQGDHLDSARLLLYHHAPVDDVTVDYLTPLHVAAHCGHHKVAKLLLDRKANPSARALNGFTPLHIACKKNRVKVIELLLKYGASVKATTESGLTPLHVAAFMGNINIVMYLIKNGGGVDETNVRGETPLHLAARANQIEVIRVLLSNGAKVDARAHENQTPLHIAARLGNAEIVKLLLDNGASPDAQTRDLYTALHIAAREGKEDVAKVLLDNGASLSMTTKKEFTPLHVAAKYGRYDVAQLLLSRYASPDATAQNGLTPLHIAAHYDNVKVAMLLLDQGATPHKTAKNGFTPLHIAAKKNQMDVATTLLEYGADANAMTKQGISPIHLAAQEGHTEMLALLLERGAKPNITAKNGLTPLHLAAQEDQVEAVAMLLDNGAQIDPSTRAGYTPLHVACHYGNLKTATYLLEHGSAVQAKTKHGLTPLHQGAQQGHVAIINILLQHKADPNETANNGYTALGIAKRFGYISVVNTLTIVTTETSTVISPTEEKLKVQVPETMQVTFMSDTEDEDIFIHGRSLRQEDANLSGDDVSMTGDQSLLTPQEIRNMGDDSVANDNRRSWEEDWMRGEPVMSYYTGADSLSGHYNAKLRPAYSPTGYSTMDSRNSTLNRDYSAPLGRQDESLIEGEITVKTESMLESAPPLLSSTPARPVSGEAVVTINGKAYNMGDPFVDENGRLVPGKAFGPNGRPVSVTLDNAPLNSMPFFAGFLISFIVDARGGTMRSCRLPGLRVVVPPQRASGPTRVTCRLIKRTKLTTQPPLMENESLASRVLEVGPANTQFLGPVLIEVPHFASLRGREREIVILRSENGETWKEHSLDASDEEIQKAMEGYDQEDNDQSKNATDRRLCRILTKDFPQYFAIISRVRQETNTIGPSGGMLSSTVVPQVQAVFPEGTLTKKIKVGLQAQHVGNDVVKKVLGNRVMVSPIVTIEPRRRKFHKPITVTIPVPTAYNQGNINGYGWDTPTLRLLCSITGGTAPAQWEDITGTTPLTFVNDCVSFTTTVSARFWLMDCKEIDQASNFARELYQELKAVPFMAKFVVYAKTHDPVEGRIRVFCVTDDRSDKSLEQQENFKEVARSKFVEVLESRPVYVEMAGNLVPVQKSGDQLNLAFNAFHENRLPFFVRVRDQSAEKCGRLSFMREPKQPRGLPPQKAACNLNVTMPPYVKVKKASESESESEESSEDEEYRMEKGEREQYSTQKEQKLFTKKELYSLTSIEEYQVGSKEQDGVPSNLNFASIKLRKKYTFLQDPSMSPKSAHQRAEIRLWDVANQVGDQWQDLGRDLGLSERELKAIEKENEDTPEQAFVMLHNWAEHEGKDASSEKLEDGLRSIGRGDIIDRCLGNYVSLDVSAQPEEEEESDLYRDIQMAMDSSRAEEQLQNDLEDLAAKGEISLEFSGVQATPDLLPSAVEEQARKEVTDKLIQELKEEAIEPSSSEDIKESAAAAEFYEDIKEEILEKHEEERRELHFEPSFGTLEETKEEESPSPTGPEKSNVDMASSGPSSSKSVTITQTRVTIASKTVDSSQPVESGSESSAETAVFSGTTDKTLEGAADQIRVQVDSISSEGEVKVDELEGVQLPPSVSQVSQVRIEVDEAPTPDRMSSDENLYIAHASNIVQEPEISAQAENEVEGINPHMDMEPEPIGDVVVEEPQIRAVPERQQESINPYCDMEPEPIGDVVIEEPQIQASAQQRQEGINPYAEMEPEPLTGAEPVQEPSVSAVSTSTVQGINPDLIGDSDVLDATCNIPGPDLTDIRHTSMGAQSWEGETSPGQQAYSQSPQEDLKVGHPGESTVQQITLESKIVVSKSEVERSEPLKSGYSVTTTEVTVSESGSPRVDEDEVPLATEQFAEEVQKTVRPATLDEPVHERQEKGEVTWKETTSSETKTRTVKRVEQTVTILQEKTDEPKLVPSEQHEHVQESAEERFEAHVEEKEPPAQVPSDHEEPEHQVDIRQKIKQFEAKIEEASMPSQPKEAVVKEDKKHVPAEATHAPDRPDQETEKFEKEKATVDDIPKSKSDDIPDTDVHSFVEEKTIITKGMEVQLQESQGEKEEVDGGVFSKPVPPADVDEKEADIPGQQVREYVSTVVDSVIIQKQYRTEDAQRAVDKSEEFKEPQDVSIPDKTLPEEIGERERDALLPASQTEKEVVEHTVTVVKETHMFQEKEMAYPAEEPKDVEKDIPTDSQPEGPAEEKMAEETCKSQEIDVSREPMEDERDVLQSESKHEDIVVTTQTLAAMNAPDYEEDDISTSMEAMPSERDDFLEDIQEEQEMVPSDSSIEREEEKDISQTPIEKTQPEEIHREGIIEQHIDGKVITTEYKETITKDVQKVEVDASDVKEDSKPFSEPGHVICETVHHTTVTSTRTEIHTASVANIPEPGIDENLPQVSQVQEEKLPSDDTVSVSFEGPVAEPESHVHEDTFIDKQPADEAVERNGQQEPEPKVDEETDGKSQAGEPAMTTKYEEVELETHREVHVISETHIKEKMQEKEKDVCEEHVGDGAVISTDRHAILGDEVHELEEMQEEKKEEVLVDTHVSASPIEVQSVSESPVEIVQEKEKDICEERLGDSSVTPADRDTILKEEIHKLEEMPEEKKKEVLMDQEFPQDVSKIVLEESVRHTHITSTHVDVQSLSEVLAEEKEVEKDKDTCEEPVVDGARTTMDKETIPLDGVHQLEEKPGEKQEVLADQAESTFILEESIQHTQISSSPEDEQSVSKTPVEREQEKRMDIQEERPEDIAVATVDGEVILKDEVYQLEEMPEEKQKEALVEEERPKISSTHVDVQSLSETAEEKGAITIDDVQETPKGDGVTNTERETIPQDEVHQVDEMLGEKQKEALVDQEPPLEESKVVLEETIQHTQISSSHVDIQTVSESSIEREQGKEKDIIEERLGDRSVTAVDRETILTKEIHQLEEIPVEKQEEVPVDQKPLHEESKVVIEETVQHTHISASSIEVQSVSESPADGEQEKEKDICEERLGDESGTAVDRETILTKEIHQLEEIPVEKQEEVPVDHKPLHEESKVVIEETVQHTHISASSIEVQSVSETPADGEQEKEKDICEERLEDKSGTAVDRETILKEEIHQLEEMPEEKQEEVPVDQKPLHEESKVVIEETVQHTHISASSIEVQSVSESPADGEQEKEKDICEERLEDKSGTAVDRETILKEEIHQLEEMPEEKQEEVPVDQKPLHEESKVVIEETIQHTHISTSSIEVQSVSESPADGEQEKEKDICEERLEDKSGTAVDRETILKEEIHQLEEMPEEKQEEVPVDQKPLHEESKVVIEETVQHTHISASSIEVQSVSESPADGEQEKEKDICEERLEDKSGTAVDRETILKEEIHQLEEMPEEKQEKVPVDQKPLHEESKVVVEETIQHTHVTTSPIEIQSVSESPVEREQEKEKDICEERLWDKSGTAVDRETILKEEMPEEKKEEIPVDQKPLHEESKVVIEETVQHTHISASSIEVQSVSESPVEREEKEKDICEERLGDKSGTAVDRETILKEEIHQLEEMPEEKQEKVPVDQKPLHEESKVVVEETIQHTHVSTSPIEIQSVSESPVEREQEKEKDICEERLGDKSGTAVDRETILKEEICQLEEMPEEKKEEIPVDQKPLHEESKVVIEETVQHTHISASSIEVQSVSESPVEREQEKEKDICEERLGEKSVSSEDRETIMKEEVHHLEEMPVEKKEEVIIDQEPVQDESKIVIEESIQHTHISSTQDVHLLTEVPAEEKEVQEENVCKDIVGDVATDKGTVLMDEASQLEEMPEDNQEGVLVDQEPPQEESKLVMEESILHTHSLSIPVDVQSSSEAPAEEKKAQRGEDICEEPVEDGATPTVDRDTILKEEVHQLAELPEIMQEEVPVGQETLQEESKAVIEESVQHTHILSTHVEMQLHEEKRAQEEEKDICEKQLEDKGVTTTDGETILKDEIRLHEEFPAEKPEEKPAEKPEEIKVDHESSREESSVCDEGIQHTTIYATHTEIQVVSETTVTEKEEAHPDERDKSFVQPHSLEVKTEEKVEDAVAVDYKFPQEDVQQRDQPQPDSDVDKLGEAASDKIEPEPKAEKVLDSADESFTIHTVETVHEECTEEDTLTTEYRETVMQLPDVKEDEKHTPHKEHEDVQESVQLTVITTHTEVNVPKEASSDQPQVTFSPPLSEHPQELSMEQSHTSTKEEVVSDERVEEPVLSHDYKEVVLKEEVSSPQEGGAADTIDDIQPSLENQTRSEQQENLEKEVIFHEVVEQATVTSSRTEIHITAQKTAVEKQEIPEPHFDEAEGETKHPGGPSQGTVHEERVDIQDQIPTDLQESPAGEPHDTLEESMQEVAITSAPTETCVSTEGLESERQEPSTEPETSIPVSLPCDVEKVDECIPTTEHKETILKDEEQLDKETLPVEKDIPESAGGYEDAEPESVQQTVSTTTHSEVHISSTTTIVKEGTEEEAKSTPAEREDLSPIEEGVTSGEVVEYQEDRLAEPGEAASLRDQSAAYVERVIRTVQTREVRFVEETMMESSEPEDDVHIEDELDLTERDISMDDEHSDDSDMIPEIKLDLQSEEIVQDDEAVAERRARDHGYLIEPDPPTEESEIILGEDGISSEQLGVDDEDDYDMRTESISYMEEHVEEVPPDGQEGTESDSHLPSHSMLETTVSTVPMVQDDGAKPPGRDKEDDNTVTSYKSIEQAMIVEKELYLESQPGEMDGETEQEIPSNDVQTDSGPEDGRGTPDILDITGEYATSYSHIEMMSHSYDVAEPGHQDIPSDKDAAVSCEQDQIETETGEPLHGTALAEIEQQYAVQTPASEREFQGQWVESQEGDAIVRTRQSQIEETYEDQTEDGTVVYHRKVVTETRVVTGEPFDERLTLSSQAPQDLVIHPQPPSPDSLVTPEIQELPDTPESLPESSTHDGSSVGPSDHQEFCYDSTSVAEASSESRQLLYEDVQEPESHFQVQDTVLVDGPTESDYYDPNLIGNQHQEHVDFYDPESQQMGSEPEVLDSPQEVELPHGEDVDIMQYQDLSAQEQVSVSISYSEQAVTHTQFDEAMLTEALAQHAEEEDHYDQAPAHDQEVFQIEDSDRADSVVSPRPPEPISDVESHLPPVDVNFLESEPSADQEETAVEEGEETAVEEGEEKDEVDSPTKPFRGPMPAADPSEDEEDTESAQATGSISQGSVDDSSTHYVVHEEYETKQEDGGIVKKSVHVTRTTFRREVSYPGEETQFGEAILQTRSSSEYLADHKETQPRQRQPMVDEQLEAPDVVGDVQSKKPTYSPEELEDFAEVLNEFSATDLPEDEQEQRAPPSDQPLVQEDCSMTESVPPKVETNLKMLDQLTPEDEKELDDLLNRDFTQAYREEPEAERELAGGEPEEVSPSTPASPVTPRVDLFQDEAESDLQAAADQLEKEKEEKEEERPEGGEERKKEGDDQPREPKTPEISDFLDDQPTFPPSAPLGVVETQPNIEFPPDMDVPVDGDEDVEEEIEEYEETLDDGTIRKVIKRRIKKRTVQMIPVEIDPSQLPPGAMGEGDDDVRRITVHKKVTRKTFMRDGEEIDQQEECETNIEEDGIVKENSELREDLQQIVDGLLSDQSLEGTTGDGTTVVVEREETVEGEESEI
ncbi:uncharacterized protein [Diadema setosum]|uniref:uncharacterized protein n=1 Tax=Diadema setosum TaxID=31175 RepID=UPI003B3A4682